LELQPDFAETHNNLGAALANNAQIDAAILHFNEALNIDPDYLDAHNNLGTALEQQGKIAEAIIHWRMTIRLNQTNIYALNKLAWTLATYPEASVRNGAEAVKLSEWAVNLTRGREPALLGTLAAAYAEVGRYPDAVKTAENAISLAATQGDTATADALRRQLQFYRADSPYRDRREKGLP